MAQTFALSQTRIQGQPLVVRPRTAAKASRCLLVRAQQAGGDLTTPSKDTPQSTLDYAKQMPGVTAPFSEVFDPLNFTENISVPELRRWRESEITHGRVAMLATLGFLVQEQVENTGAGPFPHVAGPAIVHFQQVESKGAIFWEPLVFAIGLAEAYRAQVGWQYPTSSGFNKLREDYEPGNLGFDPLGLLPSDPAEKKDMQSREINNGRLAMIGIAGFVAQELLSKDEILNIITKEAEAVP
jgi:light-harvesting complex I chlorophyll a/b binding protein 1